MINLNLGDCMDAMSKMPDNAYDLAIVDPPYGIGAAKMNLGKGGGVAKSNNYNKKNWDKQSPSHQYFEELQRISKNRIIWGGNYFELPISKGWIVWQKFMDLSIVNDYSPFELAWTSYKKSSMLQFLWSGFWQGDMKNKEKRIHPTQKPVALYKWLLKNYAKEGDKILDTHLGSGSIAIACHDGGFALDAWEIDAEYHKAATERFNTHIKQLRLL